MVDADITMTKTHLKKLKIHHHPQIQTMTKMKRGVKFIIIAVVAIATNVGLHAAFGWHHHGPHTHCGGMYSPHGMQHEHYHPSCQGHPSDSTHLEH